MKIAGRIEEKDPVSAVVREMPQRQLTVLVTRESTPLDGRKSFRVCMLLDLKQRHIYLKLKIILAAAPRKADF